MRGRIRKGMLSVLAAVLAVVVTTGFMPQMAVPAYADEGTPAIVQGSSALASDAGKNNAQTVWYAGNAWRVIGFDGGGVASTAGDMTLLASDNLQTRVRFNENPNAPDANDYAGSNLKKVIDGLYNTLFSAGEQAAVKSRTLEVDEFTNSKPYSKGVSGTVTSGALWPLSTAEALGLDTLGSGELLKANDYWWLRSPVAIDYYASYVSGGGFVRYLGHNVDNDYGVRPAFNLNLESVLFTSAAEGGKSSGAAGADALAEVSANSTNEWKLTLMDDVHKSFTVDDTNITADLTAGTVTIPYRGAATGDHEYISAVIKGSDDCIKYYGRIESASDAEGASVTINIKDKLGEKDTLWVFNEQYNGDKTSDVPPQTDYASALQQVSVSVPETLDIEITGNTDTVTYNADEQSVSGYTVKYKLGENEWTDEAPDGVTVSLKEDTAAVAKGTDAKNYPMGFSAASFDINFGGYSQGDVTVSDGALTIEKAKLTITARDQTYPYTGKQQGEGDTAYGEPDEIAEKVNVSKLQGSDELTSLVLDGEETKTGEYPGCITITGYGISNKSGDPVKDNYDVTLVPGKLTITRAEPVINTIPAASPITYGETLKNSTFSGGEANVPGTFAWKDDSEAPAVSDSDKTEYDVIFTPDDTDNYDTAECKVTVTVNKADAAVTKAPAGRELAWSGKAQKLVEEGTAEGGRMQYAIGQDDKTVPKSGWDAEIPEAADPGTYYVWYKAAGDENHNDSKTACVNSEITAKKISFTVTFKVVNGSWNDGTQKAKTVTLKGNKGDTLKLSASDIPAVGKKPDKNYKAGSWDVTPSTKTAVTKDISYTYTYAKADPAPVTKISGTLLAKMTAKGKNSLVLTWSEIKGADGYDVFFAKCGSESKYKKVKTVKAGKTLKWTKKGLKTKTSYKAIVKAYVIKNGKKKYVRKSPAVHAFASGGSDYYTNPARVTIQKTSISLRTGKTYKIRASIKGVQKGKALIPYVHAPELRYKSSNTKVATVSAAGKIRAKGKGTCKIYVYAVNGVRKAVKVTVK